MGMTKDKFINMNGASFNVSHVLSFGTEKEFVSGFDTKIYTALDKKSRKEMLKTVYRIAKLNVTPVNLQKK